MIIDPHYPKIMLSFDYHNCKIQIEQDKFEGSNIYAAWVSHDRGYTLAVPYASNSSTAVRKAKDWVDGKILKI